MNIFFTILITFYCIITTTCYASVRLYNNHTFNDWKLYEGKDRNKKVCYAVSEPYRLRGFYGIKSKSWIAITFLGKNQFTVSGNTGFNTAPNSEWALSVDDKESITLHVLPNGSIWSYSSMQDVQVINSLMQGAEYFTVRSNNLSGQTALEYYSLKGLRKALIYMNENC